MRPVLVLILLLTACTAAGPGFRGLDPVMREAEGSRFAIRRLGPMAEVIRTNPEWVPRFETTARRAALAVQAESGCRARWVRGDPAMMLVGLSCAGRKAPKMPKGPPSFTCDIFDGAYLPSMGVIDLGLECTRD